MTATKPSRSSPRSSRSRALWLLVGGVAVAALILAVVLSAGDTGDGVVAEVTVSGDPLPVLDAAAPAAASGMVAPEVTGADFSGEPVAIEADGTPKAIIFLTHW